MHTVTVERPKIQTRVSFSLSDNQLNSNSKSRVDNSIQSFTSNITVHLTVQTDTVINTITMLI